MYETGQTYAESRPSGMERLSKLIKVGKGVYDFATGNVPGLFADVFGSGPVSSIEGAYQKFMAWQAKNDKQDLSGTYRGPEKRGW